MKAFQMMKLMLQATLIILGTGLVATPLIPNDGVAFGQPPLPGPPPGPVVPDVFSPYRTYWPPHIDGSLGWFEWDMRSETRYALDHGFISVCNDATRLYILVDVLDDTGDDPGDDFWLTFDVNGDGVITEGVDLNYSQVPGTHNMRYAHYADPAVLTPLVPGPIRSSLGAGFGCFFWDGTKVIYIPDSGLAPVCNEHRVWEFAIDLSEIGAAPGGLVRMGLRLVSETPDFTENVPEDFDTDFSDLIEIRLASVPEEIRDDIPEADPAASLRFDEEKSGGLITAYGVEVTQAVQDRLNTLPLVEGKTTASRVYVEVDGIDSPQPAIVYLYGTRDGDDLPGSPLSMLHVSPAAVERGRLSHTANLRLPRGWTEGTVRFHSHVYDLFDRRQDMSTPFTLAFETRDIPLYWTVPLRVALPEPYGETLPMDIDIARQESYLKAVYPVPDIRFVRLNPEFTPLVRLCEDGSCIKANAILQLNLYYDNLLLSWALKGKTPPDQMYGVVYEGGGRSDPTWSPYEPGRGLVSVGNVRFTPGILGVEHDWYNEHAIAHEINHNLDRASDWTLATWGRHVGNPDPCTWHGCPCKADDRNSLNGDAVADCARLGLPACEGGAGDCEDYENNGWGCGGDSPDPDWPWMDDHIHEYGFDTRLPWVDGLGRMLDPGGYPEDFEERRFTVVPDTCPDFMSYCDSKMVVDDEEVDIYPGSWISPYRWESLFDFFTPDPPYALEPMTVIYVSGEIGLDGGILHPAFIQDGFPTEEMAPGGEYAVEVQDPNGSPLLTRRFSAVLSSRQGEEVERIGFNFQLPLPLSPIQLPSQSEQLPDEIKISKIVLKRTVHQEEEILDDIVVSENPPSVIVVAPKGGEYWQGLETIEWRAEDQDEEALLSFTILYSPDDGNSWFPVAWLVQGESYEVNTAMLPGGDKGKIRVIVTDGFNTGEADSDGRFMVPGKPPKAFIIGPSPNSHFSSGEVIAFEGDGHDLEDEFIADTSFAWSYGSTVFGQGRNVHARLPGGLHEVTLTVFDSDDNVTRETVVISVASEMECFEVNRMRVTDRKRRGAKQDRIEIQGSLKLAYDAMPFDPEQDVVTVTIDSQAVTIPKGSFVQNRSARFRFKGHIPNVGFVHAYLDFRTCWCRIHIRGLETSGLLEGDGAAVKLSVGMNIGNDDVDWTRKWNWGNLGLGRFVEWPAIRCCQLGTYD
ncbi:MAG: hypothetical protein SWH78_12865 [Thermodesulfobacteriota bacterium]|nr:hypothetical protein [Thermodesulfobacteriota bacterium]